MYLILFVLHQVENFDRVLDAWEEVGIGGVTILPSTGLGRLRQKAALRDDLPLIPSLDDLLQSNREEMLNRTMFTIVENEEVVEKVVQVTEAIIGQLDQPDTGILTALPLARVYGLQKRSRERSNEPKNR